MTSNILTTIALMRCTEYFSANRYNVITIETHSVTIQGTNTFTIIIILLSTIVFYILYAYGRFKGIA